MKVLWVLILCYVTFGGFITPKTTKPVLLEYNNAGYVSDYTFTFQIETSTFTWSELHIEFPDANFAANFVAAACTATDEKGNNYSSCAADGYKIKVGIGELSNSPVDHSYVVIIKDVTNPTTTGGTGNFKLSTWRGINPLDNNDRFPAIGIIAAATQVNFSIICDTNCYPSLVSTYTLKFTSTSIIKAESRVTIQFPTTVSLLGPPPCTTDSIPRLEC